MNLAVHEMLKKYQITDSASGQNALKEVIQEIALLGLQRANFFEKAAFYGGTALRILYGLPRYSEDLDFTLLQPNPDFSLKSSFSAVQKELEAYGFQIQIESVEKKQKSSVDSAFIKADTQIHFLKIDGLKPFENQIQKNMKLQIKFEVDTNPATNFQYESRYLLAPISFPIISLKKPDLFAGKLHALLFRKWKTRIKGRDFYDYVWYLKNKIPVRLAYLQEKIKQSENLPAKHLKNREDLIQLLNDRFSEVDFAQAKEDVFPFIKDHEDLQLWSKDFFTQISEGIQVV